MAGECAGCGRKNFGLVSLLRGLGSGAAGEKVQAARLTICRACGEQDAAGKRLYREQKGGEYCGIPRLAKVGLIYRDEAKGGCGCELKFKTSRAEAACPRGKWDVAPPANWEIHKPDAQQAPSPAPPDVAQAPARPRRCRGCPPESVLQK